MDQLYILHIFIAILILSIVFWPYRYLKYGVYIPFGIATVWLVFDGCPITNAQHGLKDNSFTLDLAERVTGYKFTMREISHALLCLFLLITIVGLKRIHSYELHHLRK
jgi:hypothetical protein